MRARTKYSPWALCCGFALAVAATTIDIDSLMGAIRAVESGGNAFAIHDNSANRSYTPATRTEAIDTAKTLLALGHNIDMGLMQVNSIHLARPGITLDNIFDVSVQATLSKAIFTQFYTQSKAIHGDTDQAVWFALGAYNMGPRGLWVYNVPYISKVAVKLGYSPAAIFAGAETLPRQVGSAVGMPAGRALEPSARLEIPGQWRVGERLALNPASEDHAAEDDGDSAGSVLMLLVVIVVVVGLVLLLKLKLLWWLCKLALKAAARESNRQMTKRRETI